MDPIYILTGLGTVVAAIAGLVITCRLERRALAARRARKETQTAARRTDGRPVAT